MSFEITTAFVEQYKRNVDMLVRQQGSRFRSAVRVDNQVVGKSKFTEQIGSSAAVKRTSRHADTPLTPAEHARRKYDLFDYEWADLIDDADRVKMLIDPTNDYALAARDAMGHAMDDEIIAAATGDSKTGADGTTTTVLPTSQKVAVDYAESGATPPNIGLTVAKLRRASYLFRLNDVNPSEQKFIAVGAQQVQDLLTDSEVTSADYNTVRALVNGEINTYMGFTFIDSQRLTLTAATDVRTCFAWVKSGIELGIGKDWRTRISERDDKSYSTQVYACMTIGSTRLQEKKVVEISCDESP